MQMRCYRCGFSFAVSRETLATALTHLTVSGQTHHIEYCPRCRTANKIDRQTLARFAPPPGEEDLAAARAALESSNEAESDKPEPSRAAEPEVGTETKKKKHRRRRGSGAPETADPQPQAVPVQQTVEETSGGDGLAAEEAPLEKPTPKSARRSSTASKAGARKTTAKKVA